MRELLDQSFLLVFKRGALSFFAIEFLTDRIEFLLEFSSFDVELSLQLLNLMLMRHLLSIKGVFGLAKVPLKHIDLLTAKRNLILIMSDELLVLFD